MNLKRFFNSRVQNIVLYRAEMTSKSFTINGFEYLEQEQNKYTERRR